MPDRNLSWFEIEKKHGDAISPSDRSNFFAWAKFNIPGGLSETPGVQLPPGVSWTPQYSTGLLKRNLENYYNTWKALPTQQKYMGKAALAVYPSGPAAPQQAITGALSVTSGYEYPLRVQYINDLTAQWNLQYANAESIYNDLSDKDKEEESLEQFRASQRAVGDAAIREATRIVTEGGITDPRLK